MYRLIAEQKDPATGKALTQTIIADSVRALVGPGVGRGSVRYTASNIEAAISLGGGDEDFQLVKIFDGDGTMLGSMSYDSTTGQVMQVGGPIVGR